jgi:hypothetical protein
MDSPPTRDGIKKRKNALSSCNAFFILEDRLGIFLPLLNEGDGWGEGGKISSN